MTLYNQVSRVLEVKKLVLILATSTSIIDAKKKALKHIPYIHYPVQFKKNANETQVQALINSKSEVNTIYLTFTNVLSLSIRPTDIGIQKIDGIMLDNYKIVVAAFLVTDKANQVRFFKETFLVTNISPKVVLGILFLTFSGVNVDFLDQELQ